MSDAPPDTDRLSFDETVAQRTSRLTALAATTPWTPTGSMRAPSSADATTARQALSRIASIAPPADVPLRIERTLGEGGMGLVQLATQTSLGRKVAAKSVREAGAPADAMAHLLREAWVTGALEHPNIVPVYDIVRSTQGEPVIVLKRIEGVHWGEVIGDADAIRQRFGAEDALEFDLGILQQVCNAVHFAHSRGIVHRDLKPENVMIGSFGEVYVLDWGIAVDVGVPEESPLKSMVGFDRNDVSGTPAYMAPEMLDGAGHVGVWTDVYLLGGMLHEIMTGKPPHDVAGILELVRSISTSTPRFPPGAPAELVDLCSRALARDRRARPASAEAFRHELSAFLRHRGSAQLAAEATERLERLRKLLASAGRRTAAPADERRQAYELFSECRFAFKQALRGWPENAPARAGLDAAITSMIDYELGQEDARAASALLGELAACPPELAARVEKAQQAHDERRKRMRRLERSADQSVSRSTRASLTAALAIGWGVFPLLRSALGDTSLRGFVLGCTVLCVATLALGVTARKALRGAPFNRRLFGIMLVLGVAQIAVALSLDAVGASVDVAETGAYSVWLVIAALATILVDRATSTAVVTSAVALVVMARWPAVRSLATLLGYSGLLVTLAWRAHRDRAPDPDSRGS